MAARDCSPEITEGVLEAAPERRTQGQLRIWHRSHALLLGTECGAATTQLIPEPSCGSDYPQTLNLFGRPKRRGTRATSRSPASPPAYPRPSPLRKTLNLTDSFPGRQASTQDDHLRGVA